MDVTYHEIHMIKLCLKSRNKGRVTVSGPARKGRSVNGVIEVRWQLHVIKRTDVLVVAEEVSRLRGMDGTGQQRENTEVRGCPGRKSGPIGLDAVPQLTADIGSCRCQEEA